MKFFKHFTDAHEGKSMMALMNKFGLEGYAAFFILTEICAKKLEKEATKEFTEDQLKFTFNERIVREKLRMRSTKVELFLNFSATLDLLQFTKVKDEYNFYFPKLLESLDRDSKRARTLPDIAAPKIKIKNKEEDKDKDKEENKNNSSFNFEILFEEYPNKINKAEGIKRLSEQIQTNEDFDSFRTAVSNYKKFLNLAKNKDWLKPKQFDVFVGPKSKIVKPWKEWINPDPSIFIEEVKQKTNDSDGWLNEAEIYLKAVKSYPQGDPRLKEFLGPDRFEIWLAIGRSRIGSTRDDAFGRRDLANLIKSESQKLNFENVS